MNLEFTNLISLTSQLTVGSPCLCLPSTGVKTVHHAGPAFTQVLGISAQVLMLTEQDFTHYSSSPAPPHTFGQGFDIAQDSLELMISFRQVGAGIAGNCRRGLLVRHTAHSGRSPPPYAGEGGLVTFTMMSVW